MSMEHPTWLFVGSAARGLRLRKAVAALGGWVDIAETEMQALGMVLGLCPDRVILEADDRTGVGERVFMHLVTIDAPPSIVLTNRTGHWEDRASFVLPAHVSDTDLVAFLASQLGRVLEPVAAAS